MLKSFLPQWRYHVALGKEQRGGYRVPRHQCRDLVPLHVQTPHQTYLPALVLFLRRYIERLRRVHELRQERSASSPIERRRR